MGAVQKMLLGGSSTHLVFKCLVSTDSSSSRWCLLLTLLLLTFHCTFTAVDCTAAMPAHHQQLLSASSDRPSSSMQVPSASECMSNVMHFLHWHQKKLLQKRRPADLCLRWKSVSACMWELVTRCADDSSQEAALVRYHRPVLHHYDCTCNSSSHHSRHHSSHHHGGCGEWNKCVDREIVSPFAKGCLQDYEHNLQQPHSNACFFLQQAVYCRQALVTSSCDAQGGRVAAHMTALLRRDGDGSTDKCITSLHHDNYRQHYTGFEYTAACPVNMISHINSCTQKMTPLQFDEQINDLIVKSDEAAVREACTSYREWMECMQHLSSSCSQGISKALDLEDGRARRYFRKLAFICGSKGSEYLTHLSCYKKSVKKESAAVSPCFNEVKTALQPSHAYTFFCLPHSAFTIDVKQKLVTVRGCYEHFYSAKCSRAAAAIMGEMIEEAFDDPHYLRMGFRPDCHLHNASRDSLLASRVDAIDSHDRNVIGNKGQGRDEPITSHKEESMFSAFTSSTTSSDSQHAVPSAGITSTPIPSSLVYLDSDISADGKPASEWPVGDGKGEEGGVLLPTNYSRSDNFSNSPLMSSIQGPSNDTFVQPPLPPSTKLPPASVHTTLPTPTTIVNPTPPSHHDHRHSSMSTANGSKPALTSHHRSTSASADDDHPLPVGEGTSQHKHGSVRAALASSAARPYVTILTAVSLVTYSVALAVATR